MVDPAPVDERGSASDSDSGAAGKHPRDRLARELSLTYSVLLVVASVIGAGIFFTPGRVAELTVRRETTGTGYGTRVRQGLPASRASR